MSANPMIQIKELSVHYQSTLAVDAFSFDFEAGKVYGISGPNGAGKSSLLNVLSGLVADFDGEYFIGNFCGRKQRQKIRPLIGYAPEDPELLPYLSGREYLQMMADIRGLADYSAVDEMLDLTGIDAKRDELIRGYSHGMRQKISLASALIARPPVLLLDEALNGLDPLTLIRVKDHFRECTDAGTTILLASHVLELVSEWCADILIMNRGKIAGRYDRQKAAGTSLPEYFLQVVSAGK